MNARSVPAGGKARHESQPEGVLVLDLGLSRVRAALLVDGRPQVIDWPELGKDVHGVPVVFGVDPGHEGEPGRIVIGDEARRLALAEPSTMLEASPRLLGVRAELLDAGETWRSVAIVRGHGGDVQVELEGETWAVPRLLGYLLQQLVHRIERRHALTIERTIVGVAAGADDPRRRALLHALRIAGLPEPTLVHGTSAAALAWWTLEREGQAALGILGLEAMLSRELELGRPAAAAKLDDEEEAEQDDEDEAATGEASETSEASESGEAEGDEAGTPESLERTVLLFDLGAGSFDAALVRCDATSVEVLGARSRLDVGGIDIDDRIAQWLLEQFEAANEIDLSGDPLVRARVRAVAEKTKLALTDAEQHDIQLPFLWADASGPKHLVCTLERARFERMIADIVEVPAEQARELLADAGLAADDLDAIVMVGGSSRVPVIQDRLEALLGRVPETELSNRQLDDDFVVRGLALEAKRRAKRRPDRRVVELASKGVWLRSPGAAPKLLIEPGGVLPIHASVKLGVDTSVGLGWNDAHELWQAQGEGELGTGAWARAEYFQPALCFRLGGERPEVEVHVELDASGCLGVRIDERVRGKEAFLRIERRPGLSERALRRYVAQASDRAHQTALRDRHDSARRALQELVRTIEGWLADAKLTLDDTQKAGVQAWRRDAEVVLALGSQAEVDMLVLALESFDGAVASLPAKLRDGVSGRATLASVPELPAVEAPSTPEEDDYGPSDAAPRLVGWVSASEGAESDEDTVEDASLEAESDEVEAEAEVEVEADEVEAEVEAEAEVEVEADAVEEDEVEADEVEAEAEVEVEADEVEADEVEAASGEEAVAAAAVEDSLEAESEVEARSEREPSGELVESAGEVESDEAESDAVESESDEAESDEVESEESEADESDELEVSEEDEVEDAVESVEVVEPGDEVVESAGDEVVESAGDEVVESAGDEVVEGAGEPGDEVVESAGDEVVEPAGEPAGEVVESAGEVVEPAGEVVVEGAGEVVESVGETAELGSIEARAVVETEDAADAQLAESETLAETEPAPNDEWVADASVEVVRVDAEAFGEDVETRPTADVEETAEEAEPLAENNRAEEAAVSAEAAEEAEAPTEVEAEAIEEAAAPAEAAPAETEADTPAEAKDPD